MWGQQRAGTHYWLNEKETEGRKGGSGLVWKGKPGTAGPSSSEMKGWPGMLLVAAGKRGVG